MFKVFIFSVRIYTSIEITCNKAIKLFKQPPMNRLKSYEYKIHEEMYKIVLYYDYLNASKYSTNVLIMENGNFQDNNYQYKESQFCFLDIIFTINNNDYKINLKKPFNYYIISNVLNKSFFIHYLLNEYPQLMNQTWKGWEGGVLKFTSMNNKKFSIESIVFKEPMHLDFKLTFLLNSYELIDSITIYTGKLTKIK
jgi:hypothetical protein